VLKTLREKGWSAELHAEATIKSRPHMVDILVLVSPNHKVCHFVLSSDKSPIVPLCDIFNAL